MEDKIRIPVWSCYHPITLNCHVGIIPAYSGQPVFRDLTLEHDENTKPYSVKQFCELNSFLKSVWIEDIVNIRGKTRTTFRFYFQTDETIDKPKAKEYLGIMKDLFVSIGYIPTD